MAEHTEGHDEAERDDLERLELGEVDGEQLVKREHLAGEAGDGGCNSGAACQQTGGRFSPTLGMFLSGLNEECLARQGIFVWTPHQAIVSYNDSAGASCPPIAQERWPGR